MPEERHWQERATDPWRALISASNSLYAEYRRTGRRPVSISVNVFTDSCVILGWTFADEEEAETLPGKGGEQE